MSYDNWEKIILSEIVASISTSFNFNRDKLVLVNTSDVLEGKVLNHKFVKNEKIKGQFKKAFEKGDILYSEIRPKNKRFAYIDFDPEGYVASTKLMVLRGESNKVDNKFLYQILTSTEMINKLHQIAESRSGTFPQITFTQLGEQEANLPPLDEQKAIASILSSLDDKIELNNKINQNLETLAQTLYKHWFVDFEFPNENGEPYKSSGGELIESELGLIPMDWSEKKLGDFVIKQKIKTLPNQKYKLIDMANMPSYSISLSQYESGDKLNTNTFLMKKHSFLYGSIRPYLGKYGIAPFDGITTGTIHNFVSKYVNNYSFIASTVFSNKFNDYCIQLSHGTKMPIVKWNDFIDYKLAYNERVSSLYDSIIKSNYLKIVENVLENQKLAEIRDTLLPKLMNGEIEVPV